MSERRVPEPPELTAGDCVRIKGGRGKLWRVTGRRQQAGPPIYDVTDGDRRRGVSPEAVTAVIPKAGDS